MALRVVARFEPTIDSVTPTTVVRVNTAKIVIRRLLSTMTHLFSLLIRALVAGYVRETNHHAI
ncbi:hypothetical protein CCP3SC1_470003 [Gammaproteobacteria bacterium]